MKRGEVGRWLRAAAVVSLLTGSLFPPVFGVSVAGLGLLVAALLLLHAVFRPSAGHFWTAIPFVVLLGAALLLPVALDGLPPGGYGREKVTALGLTLASALAVAVLRDRDDLGAFGKVWVAAAIMLATFSIGGPMTLTGRTIGFDSNPIWLGRVLGIALVVAAWMFWRREGNRLFYVAAFLVVTAGLLATGSRGPLIGVVVALTVLMLRALPRLTMTGVAYLHFAAGGLVLWLATTENEAFRRLTAALVAPEQDGNTAVRADMWAQTLHLIADHPGGIGYGQWANMTALPPHIRYPHNLFLEVFAEAGWVPGIILVLTCLAVLVRLVQASRAHDIAFFVLIMLVAEVVSVSTSGDLNARTFFALLVLGHVTTRRLHRDDLESGGDQRVTAAHEQSKRRAVHPRSQ